MSNLGSDESERGSNQATLDLNQMVTKALLLGPDLLYKVLC